MEIEPTRGADQLSGQRIDGIDPEAADGRVRAVLEAQVARWGAPLRNQLVYARVPAIFRAVRGMWAGLAGAGLVDERLQALLNRRVAALNGCEF
jgi:hypothetical protein